MLWEPYRLLDAAGAEVEPVGVYLREVQAAGCAEATLRSYGLDLLRWFRFLWAVEVAWDRATRVEARDFSRWLQIADGPRSGGASRGRVEHGDADRGDTERGDRAAGARA